MQPRDRVARSIHDLETTINGHPDFFSRATTLAEAHDAVKCLWTAIAGLLFRKSALLWLLPKLELIAVLVEMVVRSFGNAFREDHGTRESPN